MPEGNPRVRRPLPNLRRPFWALWGVMLLAVAACAPLPPPPPPIKTPSKVISENGAEFFVYSLKFPGTTQEFKMRVMGSLIWLPLSSVRVIRLWGPEQDNYRQAELVLISGEKFQGEVYVGQLIEGTTDVGYWNMPFKDVRILGMGEE
jgi:hypothetical protein